MNRTIKHTGWITALASLIPMLMPVGGSVLLADSLVTTDGVVMIGTVSRTATGYTIQTADGPVNIATEKVKRVLYDHPHPEQPTGTDTAPGTAPGTITGAAGGKKAVDPREITALTQQGLAAMAAGEFADARDAFTDLLSLDNNNALAARGLGYAYLKMEKPTQAVKPLEMAALVEQPDRNLTIALAASLVASHNPMRAAKFVKGYLEAHPTPLDEPMINTVGISLAKADSVAAKSALFIDGVKLYNKLNADLEANQPGKKRWGIEWEDADEVTKKQKIRQDAQKQVDSAWSKLQAANTQLQTAQGNLTSVENTPMRATIKRDQTESAQKKVSAAETAADKAQSVFDDASKSLAEIPGPVFPDTVALEDVDLSLSPAGALASATPGPIAVSPVPTTQNPVDLNVPPVIPSAPPDDDTVEPHPAPTPSASPAQAKPPQAKPPAQAKPNPASPATAKSAGAQSPPAAGHVTRYAVAFAVAPDMVVTAASVVEGASDIEITTTDGKNLHAEVVKTLHGAGLALLKVTGVSLPCLPLATTPSGGAITCLGFPDVALFNPVARQITGTANDQTAIETDNWAVSLGTSPRLPGSPLMKAGTVIGVELGDRDSDPGQVPAATLKSLLSLAQSAAHPGSIAQDPRLAIVMVKAER